MTQIELGPWEGLDGGFGDSLAIAGPRVVAASSAGITVWNGSVSTTVWPSSWCGGKPTIDGSTVRFGAGIVDERGYRRFPLPDAPIRLLATAWTRTGALAAAVANPDGSWSAGYVADAGFRAVGDGQGRVDAIWASDARIVVVGDHLVAVPDGIVRPGHPGGVAALDATPDGRLLLTVGHEGRARLCGGRELTPGTDLVGAFCGGALTPNGSHAVLLTTDGALLLARVAGLELEVVARIGLQGDPVAVAASDDAVVASFRIAPFVRRAALRFVARP